MSDGNTYSYDIYENMLDMNLIFYIVSSLVS